MLKARHFESVVILNVSLALPSWSNYTKGYQITRRTLCGKHFQYPHTSNKDQIGKLANHEWSHQWKHLYPLQSSQNGRWLTTLAHYMQAQASLVDQVTITSSSQPPWPLSYWWTSFLQWCDNSSRTLLTSANMDIQRVRTFHMIFNTLVLKNYATWNSSWRLHD